MARLSPRLLALRTADDLFLEVGTVTGVGHTRAALPVLAARLGQLDLAGPLAALRDIRELPDKPTFDVVASLSGQRKYNRYAVEDIAGGVLGQALGGGYVSRSAGAGDWPAGGSDLTVRLFLHGTEVQVALRAGPRPLHRRGWKVRTGPGSLHPPVAAALARIARRPAGGVIADPFCGDGTIPVEVALADPAARVLAADLDAARLGNARANAAQAGVPVRFIRADAAGRSPGPAGWTRWSPTRRGTVRSARPAGSPPGWRRSGGSCPPRSARAAGSWSSRTPGSASRPACAGTATTSPWSRASGWPGGYPRSWSRRRRGRTATARPGPAPVAAAGHRRRHRVRRILSLPGRGF